MLVRPLPLAAIRTALRRNPIAAILGPRQCGKTTLARQLLPALSAAYFDLEDPAHLERLAEPMLALGSLRGLVVIDEVQRRPELFPALRVLADRPGKPARFLLLGSAAPALLRQASESLAGRLEIVELGGLLLSEVGPEKHDRLWRRGGFPRSFLARSEADSVAWREQFVRAFLERDLPQLASQVAPSALRRFWTVLAHFHGQIWNASEAARTLDVSMPTTQRWLELLEGALMIRVLRPFHANLLKRQVKAPKLYFRDPGLLHLLLGIRTERELLLHPRSGASWEGFALEEVLRCFRPDEAFFWATHSGAELDLLLLRGGRRIGVEFKRSDAPKVTPSMRAALEDLELDRLLVVTPGAQAWPLAAKIEVVPLTGLSAHLR